MSTKLAQLVKLIKKTADELDVPDAPGVTPAAPAGQGGQGRGRPEEAVPSSTGPVKKMQQALINLAQNVIAETGTSQMAPQPGQAGTSQSQTEAVSRTSFADFITMHYASQSDVPATEFDPNPGKTQMDQKDPSQAKRMNTVMDTMSRIGGEKGEFTADGKWGPRTNTAIKNAYALAFALIQMAADFKFTPTQYNAGNLAQFKPLIPEDPEGNSVITDPTALANAKEITAQVNGINKLFQEVKQHILQNPGYQSYIEGDEDLATVSKPGQGEQGTKIPDEQLVAMSPWMERMFPQGLTVQTYNRGDVVTNFQFGIADLASATAFKAALARATAATQQQVRDTRIKIQLDPNNVLQQINSQLEKKIAEFDQHAKDQATTQKGSKQWLPPEYFAPDAPPPQRQN